MITKELFKGIAVIIDDEISNPNEELQLILQQINSENIPTICYSEIPDDELIKHFGNLSFLILDWRLVKQSASNDYIDGARIPSAVSDSSHEEVVEFIKKVKSHCFCPIFIFTNDDPEDIKIILEENSLYKSDKPNHIFILRKSDFKGESTVFSQVESWIKKTPSVYVLKEWEKEYEKSKNKFFNNFYNLNPSWPKVMWKTFGDDGANKSIELGELITRNLYTRMVPFEFKDELLSEKSGVELFDNTQSELRKVLVGERFLTELDKGSIGTGDIFSTDRVEDGITKTTYYLNIRAQCDLIPRNGKSLDKINLYCLKGRSIDEANINQSSGDGYTFHNGQFLEKTNHVIVGFIADSKIVEFFFNEIFIKKWKDIKGNRIGRLLPPYINRVQQRYALYLQRQGTPSIPKEAILQMEEDNKQDEVTS